MSNKRNNTDQYPKPVQIIIDKELMKVLPPILSAWKRVQNQVSIHHRVHYIEPSVWNDNELADWIIQEIELGEKNEGR